MTSDTTAARLDEIDERIDGISRAIVVLAETDREIAEALLDMARQLGIRLRAPGRVTAGPVDGVQ